MEVVSSGAFFHGLPVVVGPSLPSSALASPTCLQPPPYPTSPATLTLQHHAFRQRSRVSEDSADHLPS